MKRTTFIAPVESMRGNLSGKQDLRYANNDNKAFDAPEGRQYAKNYRASYIGARRAADGLTYFAVKTKSATKIDAESLNRMACLGAAGAMVGSIYRQKSSQLFENLLRVYGAMKIQGAIAADTSLRKWLFESLYTVLSSKRSLLRVVATVGTTEISAVIVNPYVSASAQTEGAEISTYLIEKFWMQLAANPIKEKISGTDLVIVSHENETFGQLIASNHNFLGLVSGEQNIVSIAKPITGALNVTKSDAVDEPFTITTDDPVATSGGGKYFIGSPIVGD